eukprot:6198706-Pleurochrysis_carterae.AAC.2
MQAYLRCEGEVVSVADGTSDKRSERARTLLPAGALKLKWPEDVERDENKSFTWTILQRYHRSGIATCTTHGAGPRTSLSAPLAATYRLPDA